MGLEQRTSLAVAGLHWGGCIIDVIKRLEEPAVKYGIPVIHDYFGFNGKGPHSTLTSASSDKLWCVDDACAKDGGEPSFLIRASLGDAPADLPWLCQQVISMNEGSQFGKVTPVGTLIVLAETMKDEWKPSDKQERHIITAFREANIKSIFLVRIDPEGVCPIDSARNYAAFRHVAKSLGGVCGPFRRENVSEFTLIAGHHAIGLSGELSQPCLTNKFAKQFLSDCLASSSLR